MAEPQAGDLAGSAPAGQNSEPEVNAVSAESAPAEPQASTESTESMGSEPTEELGEKGKQEIITLRKRAQRAEQEAAYLRGLSEGRNPQAAAAPEPHTPQGPPSLDQYENYDDYLVAKAKHEFQADQVKREADREEQRLRNEYNTRYQKTAAKYPDLPEIVQSIVRNPSIPQNPAMARAIMESEVGPDIVYQLGQNTQELIRIASLSPTAAAREIGKWEAKVLSAPRTEPQKISQAPEPIRAVGTKGAVSSFDYEKSSMDDFMKRRNTEASARR
jgi:hypothetical protein